MMMKKTIHPFKMALVYAAVIFPSIAFAQDKGSTRDQNLKSEVEYEKRQLDEKAVLERKTNKFQGTDEEKFSRTGAQIGQSTLTSTQQIPFTSAITELNQANDAIVESLNGSGVLERMKADFARIKQYKNKAQQKRAIKQYQIKYAEPYRHALKKADVDLYGITKNLNTQNSGVNFTVIGGTHIVNESRKASRRRKPTSQNTSRIMTLSDDDFYYSNENSCALIAGEGSGFSNGELRSGTTTLIAGGCSATSTVVHDFDRYSQMIVEGKFDSFLSTVAGSVIGSSGADATVRIGLFTEADFSACTAIAAIFWIADCEVTNRNLTLSQNITEERDGTLSITARNFTVGALGMSFSTSTVGLKDSVITIDAQP